MTIHRRGIFGLLIGALGLGATTSKDVTYNKEYVSGEYPEYKETWRNQYPKNVKSVFEFENPNCGWYGIVLITKSDLKFDVQIPTTNLYWHREFVRQCKAADDSGLEYYVWKTTPVNKW